MQHAALRHDDEGARGAVAAITDHLLRAAHHIRQHAHRIRALRVRHDLRIGILILDALDAVAGELHVHVARALPQLHLPSGLLHHPRAEILIRHKEDRAILRRGLHDLHGVAARADAVAERLHVAAAVDVGDDVVVLVGVRLQKGLQLRSRAALLQRAARVAVREHHRLRRIHDLRRLRHEMHAAEDDHIRLRLLRLVTQPQRVTDEVRDLLDRLVLVVVRQDDGVALFFQSEDFSAEIGGHDSKKFGVQGSTFKVSQLPVRGPLGTLNLEP